MNRLLALPLLACLTLAGCMDLSMKVTVGKDWSGKGVFQLEMLDQMYQMVSMQAQQAGADFSIMEESELRAALEQEGGKLVRYVNKAEKGVRTIDIAFEFTDAKKMIARTTGGQLKLAQEDDAWRLTLMDNDMGAAFDKMEPEVLEQQLALFMPSMTGLKWNVELVLPKLIETNLQKVGANTARFSLDFDRDLAGKSGPEAAKLFKSFLSPKWVRFTGVE